jgi:hypothetical protein
MSAALASGKHYSPQPTRRFKVKEIVEPVVSTLAIIKAYWNVVE